MWTEDTKQTAIITQSNIAVPPPADAEFEALSKTLAARVHEADLAERRRAQSRSARWPRMLLRVLIDVVLLNIAFVLAYWARYDAQVLRDVAPEFYHEMSDFVVFQMLFLIIGPLVLYARGVYAQPRGSSLFDQVGRIAGAGMFIVCAVLLTSLVFESGVPSRLFFFYLWLAIILTFGAERYLIKQVRRVLWSRGINEHRVIIVGATPAGQRVMKHIIDRPAMGYHLIGYVDDRVQERRWAVPFAGKRKPVRLGSVQDLEQIIADQHVDEVIIALGATRRTNLSGLLARCSALRVNYRMVPDLFELRFDHTETESLDGIPLIGLKEPALRGGRLALKRAMDIGLALVALIVLAPLMAVLALAIGLEQPHGPILFRQQRAGRGGKIFTCYKFRSMRPDAEALKAELLAQNEASGPIFKMKNDPRVTHVGRLLRRTSLDELPQLFNILRGDMSFVGPRPPIPSEVTAYNDWHLQRLEVTPGLTGLWQVSGRSRLTFDEMVTLDLYYAENWSLLLDCRVLLQTLPAVLLQRGAY
jgi:exopolysaccharide biosynthesis polyprenyl glycosylphosphotransferase